VHNLRFITRRALRIGQREGFVLLRMRRFVGVFEDFAKELLVAVFDRFYRS